MDGISECYSEIVPTDNSVRIHPHSCGTLIADLESMRFSCWQAQPFEEARVKGVCLMLHH